MLWNIFIYSYIFKIFFKWCFTCQNRIFYCYLKSEEKKLQDTEKSVKQKSFARCDLFFKITLKIQEAKELLALLVIWEIGWFCLFYVLLLPHLLFNLSKVWSNFFYINRPLQTTFILHFMLYLEVDFFYLCKKIINLNIRFWQVKHQFNRIRKIFP